MQLRRRCPSVAQLHAVIGIIILFPAGMSTSNRFERNLCYGITYGLPIVNQKSGLVADIMRSTRCEYHSQVKWVKRNIRFIQSQKMAKSVVEGKTSDFWSEVKRIKGCKSTVTASVDGEVDDGCIADLFANKYKTLYNSVSYDPSELRNIHDTVDAIILDKSETSLITIDEVRISIASLKPGKADGRSGVLTDHIMHGGHNLHVYVCQLFNSMLIHGISPSSLQTSTLVPIPKDKRKILSVSDNYRAIALSSPLCKVLDTIILRKYGDLLSTCDLQNGFKEHGSTNACTFMVKETIQYYLRTAVMCMAQCCVQRRPSI